MRAHQGQRELAGEQFVIGEPRPGGTFRHHVMRLGRPVQLAQRGGEAGEALARDPGRVLPFGQVGQAAERLVHRAPHIAERQSFGQRVDRLDQRQACKARFVHNPVGMHHLQHAVVEFGGAGDVAGLPHGQELLQIILARVEKRQRQRPGIVAGDNPVGRARAVRRRRPMLLDADRDGDDLAGHDVAQFGPRAPVDGARWQMKQQVDHLGRRMVEQTPVQHLQLRPDAGEAGRAKRTGG